MKTIVTTFEKATVCKKVKMIDENTIGLAFDHFYLIISRSGRKYRVELHYKSHGIMTIRPARREFTSQKAVIDAIRAFWKLAYKVA